MTTAVESDRITNVLRAYSEQGWHRTATVVDDGSAEWLAEQVRACGAEPAFEAFTIERVDPLAASIEAGGVRIEGLPLFDCSYTGPDGIEGSCGPLGSDAPIGVGMVAPQAGAQLELRQQRRTGKHRAIVVAAAGGKPGLAAANAVDFLAPYGPPVLQVAGEEQERLQRWAERGVQAKLVAHAVRTPAVARNVVAQLTGSRPELAPIGVVTPRSGWWSCASERGGGLACWLETLRAVAEAAPPRTVQFVATSGHELDFLGFDRYLDRRPAGASGAVFWLHLGANIGAAEPNQATLRASDEDLLRTAAAAMQAHGAGPLTVAPVGSGLAGEASNIAKRGGRFVSLIGANAYFHLPADRYPEAVNVDAVGRYAAACADLIVAAAQAT